MELTKQVISKEINIIYRLVVSALVIFFVSDFCNKLLLYSGSDFYRISILFRAFYEFLFFSVLILFLNKKRMVFFIFLVLIFFSFLIGQFIFSQNIKYQYNFAENLSILNKYFFVFIIYFTIYKLQDYPEKFLKAIRLIENLFFFNAIATLIGFFFNLDFLRTYINQAHRYGFSGTIPAQNEATVFLFIAISFFYYKHFILNLKTNKIYVVLGASILLGTKAIYLFLAMLLLFHFLSRSSAKTKFVSIVLTFVIYLGVVAYLETAHAREALGYFVDKKQQHGLAYMLFSGRTQYLEQISDQILNHWSLLNYFIGGQDQSKFMIEMDLFDLYFFLGGLGVLIYFSLIFTTLFRFRLMRPFNLFFVFSFFSLAFMGGHFFSSAINALYLCLVCMYLYITQKKIAQIDEKDPAAQ